MMTFHATDASRPRCAPSLSLSRSTFNGRELASTCSTVALHAADACVQANLTAKMKAMKAQEEALAGMKGPEELIVFMQQAGVDQVALPYLPLSPPAQYARCGGAIKAAVVAHEQGDQATVQQVLMQAIHKAAPDAPDVGTPSPCADQGVGE
eukprot:2933108-Rhodomonas_salina.1